MLPRREIGLRRVVIAMPSRGGNRQALSGTGTAQGKS